MKAKPVKLGWYVNHIWFLRDQEIEIEKIWLCDADESAFTAHMIARESGYYGDRIERITAEDSNE